jgi:2-dehydro-3-deoxy-D-arabinonate dehydratase
MKLARVRLSDGTVRVARIEDDSLQLLELTRVPDCHSLADILNSDNPAELADELVDRRSDPLPRDQATLLAPIDAQEVWAAGVTYKRSQVARMEESEHGASHYDLVYTADRPELFFKATPHRVSGPGEPIRVRTDSEWSVPEPEFTLVLNPAGRIVGYTIGNDMSARDIEGENPLYLPQAKVYRQCCGLGPCIRLATEPLDLAGTTISLSIERDGAEVFGGRTDLGQLHRSPDDIAAWLLKENEFPTGAFLLTGTGIVPPDDFTCAAGDVIRIAVTGIGELVNPVVCG